LYVSTLLGENIVTSYFIFHSRGGKKCHKRGEWSEVRATLAAVSAVLVAQGSQKTRRSPSRL
jgi:hypothetical protein